MKLNEQKILQELRRLDWSYTKLGEVMGKTRQYVSYKLKHPESCTLYTIAEFAQALGLEERDLVK